MNVLALDLGTKTGWATLWDDGSGCSGVQVFDLKRGESPGMRYLRLGRWLEDEAHAFVDLVVFEQAHHRGGAATSVCEKLIGRVEECCADWGMEHQAVHSATLKKWATGNGRASKGDMIDAAANIGKRLPQLQRLADDFMERYNAWCDKEKPNRAKVASSEWTDEADAICLLGYALSEIVPAGKRGR